MTRSSSQSSQRYPLTEIFGSESNVRILRELARHGGQLSAPALVLRTGLAKASVWAGLASLEEAGIVAVAGSARTRLYGFGKNHPLCAAIEAVFEAEEKRFETIFAEIRKITDGFQPRPLAVWLYGSVARGEDKSTSDFDIAIVVDDIAAFDLPALRDALESAGQALRFTPSLIGLGAKEITRLVEERDPWWAGINREAVVLSGFRPEELAPKRQAPKRQARVSATGKSGQTAA
ncbi:MarR family transcriptional regulator [Skermanella stibiiresistens]|nr:MarR family transcriptional regulator [Skermanella stibiiresistens]